MPDAMTYKLSDEEQRFFRRRKYASVMARGPLFQLRGGRILLWLFWGQLLYGFMLTLLSINSQAWLGIMNGWTALWLDKYVYEYVPGARKTIIGLISQGHIDLTPSILHAYSAGILFTISISAGAIISYIWFSSPYRKNRIVVSLSFVREYGKFSATLYLMLPVWTFFCLWLLYSHDFSTISNDGSRYAALMLLYYPQSLHFWIVVLSIFIIFCISSPMFCCTYIKILISRYQKHNRRRTQL